MTRRIRRSSAAGGAAARHAWLDLVQQSGPFLTLPVVDRAFPDGLPMVAAESRAKVRGAVADLLATGGDGRHSVVEQTLRDILDWDQHLRWATDIPAAQAEPVPEHGLTLAADFAFYADEAADEPAAEQEPPAAESDVEPTEDGGTEPAAPGGPWRLLGRLAPWGAHPLARTTEGGWSASPVERLAYLLRARDVPIGVVTDGRWWALVWAPIGGATGAAIWDADVWGEGGEPESLRAFVALLTRARFLAVPTPETLPELLRQSRDAQEDVTDALGLQVRDAVELLLATLDRLDAESGDRLLAGVSDADLYDGAVTVMMRIVFLLFAEERRLLPSDDHVYVAGYSVGQLVGQLEGQAALAGEQTLAHRTGAWHRLLATSRALHRGVAHEDLRLPAYGGTLFDPDRFPWLEGRHDPATVLATPPAVDDRTVLSMLRAVQYVVIDGQRRRLTFRALDVEQIGYVYEGLLELEVRTATEPTLGLIRRRKWPRGKPEESCELPVSELGRWLTDVPPRLAHQLKARTGWTESKLEKALVRILDDHDRQRIRRAVGGDTALAEAIMPIAAALRFDDRGDPSITLPGRRFIAPSSRRTATGTHYTPRSLAEDVVHNTLEPLVYRPGPLETDRRDTWRIRPSTEILDLRVADIAMGSGAFLVAACRYLADRLIEAWVAEGRTDALLAARRAGRGSGPGDADVEQLALDARRLVAEHCLYGVDINPLAVEMAKLSLWLVTMDRERPFGFLDDRLVRGDSLLGLVSVDQLESLHVDPVAGRRLHEGAFDLADEWRRTLSRAADLRRRITAAPVVTIRDVDYKHRLLADARGLTDALDRVADAVAGTGVRAAKFGARDTDAAFVALSIAVHNDAADALGKQAEEDLQSGRPAGDDPRRPLHWPIAYPEVFVDAADRGFDAIIGNPPFSGGQKLSAGLGSDYLAWLQRWDGRGVKGSADLAARFVLRAERLLSRRGQLGYITTNTLVQGDTLEVGLLQASSRGLELRRGRSSHPWPSKSANLEIVNVWGSQAPVDIAGLRWLDGEDVPRIGADLEPVGRVEGRPLRLRENEDVAFQGHNVLGLGFVLSPERAAQLIEKGPHNAEALRPYVIGQDLNRRPDSSASRWIINFQEWPLQRAAEYPDLLGIVDRDVRPFRATKNAVKYPRMVHEWWKFWQYRQGLAAAITDLDHVIATPILSGTLMPVRVPTGPVFGHKCVVFAMNSLTDLSVMSSSAHFSWAVRYTSTTRRDPSYSHSDVFLTLPRPASNPELEPLGQRLDTERRQLMLGRGWGLTTTYNHVHSPAERDPAVLALRDLHAEIDHAVLAAYGWSDLDPEIGHHPTKIGTRWTVSKQARFELLDRLLEENHRRHAKEAR